VWKLSLNWKMGPERTGPPRPFFRSAIVVETHSHVPGPVSSHVLVYPPVMFVPRGYPAPEVEIARVRKLPLVIATCPTTRILIRTFSDAGLYVALWSPVLRGITAIPTPTGVHVDRGVGIEQRVEFPSRMQGPTGIGAVWANQGGGPHGHHDVARTRGTRQLGTGLRSDRRNYVRPSARSRCRGKLHADLTA
jgi:hypothetical protein